ncbi:MAG: exo-alpha-sialidase [Planctomycetales bacterium]|nr:exo-alpha-sialidase [Planctomycetales bacterium]
MNVLLVRCAALLVAGGAITASPSVGSAADTANAANAAEIVEVRKIWDEAPHNAFTDLVRFQDRWYCTFREGKAHVSPDGAARVLVSDDGETWESAARLTSPAGDVRDPKISLMPDGRLMIVTAVALEDDSAASHQSVVWHSADGVHWDGPHDVADPNFWLWRVTWHDGSGYGIGYATRRGAARGIRLYKTDDGEQFETLVADLGVDGYPNETSIVFEPDGTALCLLRRDADANTGMLGSATAPYTDWTWRDLGVRIGGPQMVRPPDGRHVAAVRLYDGKVRTSLVWIDPQAATLEEIIALPSGGDTSYPGLVWHDGLLWASYYSSHEGKTAIYLAKVKLPAAE